MKMVRYRKKDPKGEAACQDSMKNAFDKCTQYNRFKSRLYTIEKLVYRDGNLRYVHDENGYLFAQARYPTKIKPEDLPPWYVYGRYYKCFGYMSAKGVVDLKYLPNRFLNHFLKDDVLLISYSKLITKANIDDPAANDLLGYTGCDELISGTAILSFLKAAKEYSNMDITAIVSMIADKAHWLSEAYPEEFGDFRFDAAAYFG